MNTIQRPHPSYAASHWRVYYSRLLAAGKLHGNIANAMRKHNARQASTPTPPLTLAQRLQQRKCIVPLGDLEASYAELARKHEPRVKNWTAPAPTVNPHIRWEIEKKNCGRYSSRCTYTKWEYRVYVHSAALILTPRDESKKWFCRNCKRKGKCAATPEETYRPGTRHIITTML